MFDGGVTEGISILRFNTAEGTNADEVGLRRKGTGRGWIWVSGSRPSELVLNGSPGVKMGF